MGKYYFFTLDGKEIDTPLTGAEIVGAGAAFASAIDGKWRIIKIMTDKGALVQRDSITVFSKDSKKEREITIDDFPEHSKILVMAWYPNPYCREWFILRKIKRKDGEFYGCEVPLNEPAILIDRETGKEVIADTFNRYNIFEKANFTTKEGDVHIFDGYFDIKR